MTEHILKTAPVYFNAIVAGTKTFEVRRNDRGFQRGDTLVLWPFEGGARACKNFPCSSCKTESVRATVGFVFSGDPSPGLRDALTPGYVVLSLVDPVLVPWSSDQ